MSSRIEQLSAALKSVFESRLQTVTLANGELTIEVAPADLLEVCAMLRDDERFGFEQLMDVCGVDYSHYGSSEWATEETSATGFSRGVEPKANARLQFGDESTPSDSGRKRFAAVYHLLSIRHNWRLRVRSYAEHDEMPIIPSVIGIWRSADWFEREAFDLYGIHFEGHPDLRRILTDYGFVGHPFRKDFPLIGHVEMRYDPEQRRVVYQPVSIDPRVLVPRVIRDDGRNTAVLEESQDSAAENPDA